MAQVTVTLNGRTYRLECDDGEEQHLLSLAGDMAEHIEHLKARFGQVGDDRLLVMAGLMIADDLAETRAKLDEVEAELSELRRDRAAAADVVHAAQAQIAGRLSAAAERIRVVHQQAVGQRESD